MRMKTFFWWRRMEKQLKRPYLVSDWDLDADVLTGDFLLSTVRGSDFWCPKRWRKSFFGFWDSDFERGFHVPRDYWRALFVWWARRVFKLAKKKNKGAAENIRFECMSDKNKSELLQRIQQFFYDKDENLKHVHFKLPWNSSWCCWKGENLKNLTRG